MLNAFALSNLSDPSDSSDIFDMNDLIDKPRMAIKPLLLLPSSFLCLILTRYSQLTTRNWMSTKLF